jgi:hypothetical protein
MKSTPELTMPTFHELTEKHKTASPNKKIEKQPGTPKLTENLTPAEHESLAEFKKEARKIGDSINEVLEHQSACQEFNALTALVSIGYSCLMSGYSGTPEGTKIADKFFHSLMDLVFTHVSVTYHDWFHKNDEKTVFDALTPKLIGHDVNAIFAAAMNELLQHVDQMVNAECYEEFHTRFHTIKDETYAAFTALKSKHDGHDTQTPVGGASSE